MNTDIELWKKPHPGGGIPQFIADLSASTPQYFISLVRLFMIELQREGEKRRIKERAYNKAEDLFFAWYGRRRYPCFDVYRATEYRARATKQVVDELRNFVSERRKNKLSEF